MQIQATIKTISALREGVSKTTGNPWKALDVLVEWPDGDFLQRQTASVNGENVDAFRAAGINVGDSISADIQLTTDSWNGRIYNKAVLRHIAKLPF